MSKRLSPIERRKGACPNRHQHTTGPEDYLGWHEWAAEKGKTHRQKKCCGCGFYMIWEPLPTNALPPTGRRDG